MNEASGPEDHARRLQLLEEQASFAERTVEQLSAEIAAINRRAYTLEKQLAGMEDRLRRLSESSGEGAGERSVGEGEEEARS